MAEVRPPVPQWRFAFSPTLKGIYVIRYLMFSGGLSIAAGMVERAVTHGTRVWLGLLAGMLVGLVVFRGQLRPFSVPELALGREHLFFLRGRRVVSTIPWSTVRAVRADAKDVTLELAAPVVGPEGRTEAAVTLRATDYGGTSTALLGVLRGYLEPERRAALFTDDEVRKRLALE